MVKLVFPLVLVACNFGAGLMCLVAKDYMRALYWLASAVSLIGICGGTAK